MASGEHKTLRLVARYADACNLFASSPDEVAHKLDVLARHCDDEGHDPAKIERTILAMATTRSTIPTGSSPAMADYAASASPSSR